MKTQFLLCAIAGLCQAQVLSGIHASASRNVAISTDEAAFNVQVTGKLESTAAQVKNALQEAGAPNPTVIATGLGGRTNEANSLVQIIYSATFTLPSANAVEVTKGLLNLSTHLPGTLISLQSSVSYAASQARIEAMRQSLLPQLRDEAMKSAQAQAAAAGLKLGRLRAATDFPGAQYAYAASRLGGDFSAVTGFILTAPLPLKYTFGVELVFDAIP